MGHLAGIAQLVEHDLAKVGVEGPSPFSRSKKRKTTYKGGFLFLYRNLDEDPRRGAAKFDSWAKPVEANFALDANAGSASPKGWQAAAKRGLFANNPFSRSRKTTCKGGFLFFIVTKKISLFSAITPL